VYIKVNQKTSNLSLAFINSKAKRNDFHGSAIVIKYKYCY